MAPLEERFEATPPLRGPVMALSWVYEMGYEIMCGSDQDYGLVHECPPMGTRPVGHPGKGIKYPLR